MAQVLVVGIGDFDNVEGHADEDLLGPRGLEQLPSVALAVDGLAAQMAKVPGLTVLGGGAVHDLEARELIQVWRNARRMARERGDGETLIMHFAGHGVAGSGNHTLFLATRDSDRLNMAWTAPQVGGWLAEVESDPGGAPLLLLLDVCGSGRTVMQQILEGIRAQERRAWVIAACAPDEKTYQARFTTAAGMVVERLREGRLDLSPALRHVPVETLAREIDRELARSAVAEDRPAQSVLRTVHPEAHVEVPPFLPNPSYRETPAGQFRQAVETGLWQFAAAVDPALDPLHFISRASGTPQQQDIAHGCFFTGREEQLCRIKKWLEEDGQPSLMVVTGSPGSGKSALLGVVACLAHPQLREVTRQIATAIPRHVRPELNPDVAAVHARQRGPSEVLSSVASQLGLGEEPNRGWTARSVLERIAVQRDTPVTVIVDALDEASSDMALVSEVLLPLARTRRRSDDFDASGKDPVLCRVLIGTRPWWDRYAALLEELDGNAQLLDLDDIPLAQRTAELTGYLCDVLETSPVYSGPGTGALRAMTAETVAMQLGEQHKRGAFLLASLFAHYLVHQDVAPPVEEVTQRIPADLPAMLDLHLDVLERQHPCTSAVLAAVAHGYGQGMPLEVVHHVAKAFVGPGVAEPDLVDTRNALRAAAFYLRFSTDSDGRRLYRFYHQSLVDHLQRAHAVVSRYEIFVRVLDTVPGPDDFAARSFGLALPYVLRHAAQYAREAGALDALLLSASFLINCDPQLLLEHMDPGSVRAQFSALMAYSALSPLHEPWQRREWLRYTAIVWGEAWLVEALDNLEEQSAQPLQPRILDFRWGTAERQSSQPDVVSHATLVHCSGRWLAVLVNEEGVELWDARVGVFLRLFSEIPADCLLTALCSGDGPDGPLIAAGTSDGQVFVWDLNTQVLHTHIRTDGHAIAALSIGHLREAPAVMACGGGEVTLYDLSGRRMASMDVLASWLCGMEADDSVGDLWEPDLDITGYDCTAVAACDLDASPVVIAGAIDGALHVWNVDGSRHRTFPGGSQPVTLLRVLDGPGGPFVVAGAADGARAWDIGTGSHQLLPKAGASPTGTVLFDRDGRPCFVCAGTGSAVEAHRLDDPQPTSSRLLQIRVKARILALATDSHQVAAVGMAPSGTIFLSHTQDSPAPFLAPWAGHDREVVTVAVGAADPHGRVPAVSVDLSGHFQIWDAATGTAVLSGALPGITAAAAGTLDGAGAVALAYTARGQRCLEIIDLTENRRRIELRDSVDAMSIDDTGITPGITLQTAVGMFVLHPDAELPTYTSLPTLDEMDPLPVACYALARCSGQEITVVAYGSDSLARHWGRLTVHTPPEGARVLATLDETITCVAAGPWDGRDTVAVGTESGEVIILLLATGEELCRFLAHDITTATVDFVHTQGSDLLVTSGEDDCIRVWDPQPASGLLSETSFPDSLARISVCGDGVFAGFGERVAFFGWADLAQQSSAEDEMGNR
ncbi:AAA family ATPase [Streptomyces sp. NPDC008240]|uniref:AAA family ATPase n=1 Tax=Streptomyces sp. NPDC008240 TaxID=3364822 RepID=UPI0036EFE417